MYNKDKWYNGDNELKQISDIKLNTIFGIPKNKHNFFFSKNNKEIKYLGTENNVILIERINNI